MQHSTWGFFKNHLQGSKFEITNNEHISNKKNSQNSSF